MTYFISNAPDAFGIDEM